MSEARGASAGVRQYLARYAAPESALATAITERYYAALVVPAFREPAGMLEQYRRALKAAPGRVLVIVVVNAALSHAASSWPANRELLEDLRSGAAVGSFAAQSAWLSRQDCFDVLSIDRAHPDNCFPDRQGVGLARRIGCDLALALYAAARVEVPYIYNTDADAQLPAGYFGARPREPAAAIVFPFWHVPGGDVAIDAATALYELGLRYYVAGLAHAGSPFAFHSLGSAIAVDAAAYAAVRGFPKRLAGEDFYLLDKLAKVGSVWRADQSTIELSSRASLRTAHGTGVAAVKLAAEMHTGTTPFYHPEIFSALAGWLGAMEAFVRDRDLARARAELKRSAGTAAAPLDAVLEELGAWEALELAARTTHAEDPLRSRVHTWFDGFRTLKLVHGLRSRCLPSVPFRQALAAGWCPAAPLAAQASIDELRLVLFEHQARLPPHLGARLR